MPRPKKCRRVCGGPYVCSFVPQDGEKRTETVTMTVDEYETIRLIDREGLNQDECALFMQVARTTVQQIYANARRKLAEALVEGLTLRIGGGEYELCSGDNPVCSARCCRREPGMAQYDKEKGKTTMRIAVTYENGMIFQHFGHTEQFKVYDVEEGRIVSSEVVDTNGFGHGALAGFLQSLKAEVLICGGIGGGAQAALAGVGIRLYAGVSGDADQAVEALISGSLTFDPNPVCSHHGEHHHEGGCGHHSCG